MTAKADLQGIINQTSVEDINSQIDNSPVVLKSRAKQADDSSAESRDFEFRPLTEEEKEEFINSLDAEGKRIYAELSPKRKGPN